jgi:hypothetical protein
MQKFHDTRYKLTSAQKQANLNANSFEEKIWGLLMLLYTVYGQHRAKPYKLMPSEKRRSPFFFGD